MASIGKGRGWARAADHETVLRRPGQSVSPKTSELEEVIDMIYSFNIAEPLPPQPCTESEPFMKGIDFDNKDNFDKLWKQALEDRGFAIKCSKLFRSDKVDPSLKHHLYGNLQACYEKRDELWKQNPLHMTSIAWMIGGVCGEHSSQKLKIVFGSALLNCMSLLLDSGIEDDTETVAILLYLYGKDIKPGVELPCPQQNDSETVRLSDVVNKARYMHINRNVSPRARTLSLLIIDLANQQYQPFEGELQKFYMKLLAPARIPENDSAFLVGREFDQQLYLYKLLSKEVESEKKSNDSQVSPNDNRNDKLSGAMPRAIRGAGASSAARNRQNGREFQRNQREKRTEKPPYSAKRSSNNKGWEHDDRSETNYE